MKKKTFFGANYGRRKAFRKVPVKYLQTAEEGLETFRTRFGSFFGSFFSRFSNPFSYRFIFFFRGQFRSADVPPFLRMVCAIVTGDSTLRPATKRLHQV